MKYLTKTAGYLCTAIAAAIGASLCCVAPLVLVSVGITGSWMSNLSSFEPYRPIFIGVTLIALGLAYYQLYFSPKKCEEGAVCANPSVARNQKIIFWFATVLLVLIVAFPWYGAYIL